MKQPARQRPWGTRFLLAAAALVATVTFGSTAQARPLAGYSIGNTANATYKDVNNTPLTATSNEVYTIVQQVASATLTATQSKTGSPGGQVGFPHTLTNTGNGTDTFGLTAIYNAGAYSFTDIKIYADANADGVADNSTVITSTGPLNAGQSFSFVVVATIPATATNGQSATINVRGRSGFNTGVYAATDPNVDTANVSGNAIIVLGKSVDVNHGPAGAATEYTYTISYNNTGNSKAVNVSITDTLPAGLSYAEVLLPGNGKARWNVTGTTPLTDESDGTQGTGPTINYSYNSGTGKVTALISEVLATQTGFITFKFTVPAGTAPGTYNNTASVSYDDDDAVGTPNVTASSNTVPFTVDQVASVDASDYFSTGPVTSTTDVTDGHADYVTRGTPGLSGHYDFVTVDSAYQGQTVPFDVVIANTGNGTDSFNVSVSSSTFPAGTTFQFFKADGATSLSSGNTGPLASGATTHIFVKAILPADQYKATASTVTFTATSAFNAAVSDTTTLRLSAITQSSVDVTNTTALATSTPAGTAASGNAATTGFGVQATGEAAAVTTKSLNPGASETFILKINNTSVHSDSYNLLASTDNTFAATTLPTDWIVTFKADGGAGTCATTGATVTNSGTVLAGNNVTICAVVTVPATGAGAAAGTTQLYFRAKSPTSLAADVKHDAVTVNTVRSLTVSPGSSGSTFKGGVIFYTHTITNNGNITEGAAVGRVTFSPSNNLSGWTSVIYSDNNGDGIINGADTVITDLNTYLATGLAAGASVKIIVKVTAFNGASIGDVNTTTIQTTVSNTVGSVGPPTVANVMDITTIIDGYVNLLKEQALDAACDGTADTAYSTANVTTGAIPGACIRYRITATNVGSQNALNLHVTDTTPSNTTYHDTVAAATTVGSVVTVPANGVNGSLDINVGTLGQAQTAVITFGVKIDP